MTTFYTPDEESLGPARVCLIGPPGSGKTALAATFPDNLILDAEHGAGSAPAYRLVPGPQEDPLEWAKRITQTLLESPFRNGALQWTAPNKKIVPLRAVTFDSVDAVQEGQKIKLLGNRTKLEMQDWDKLYNTVIPLVHLWNRLPIHVIVISHIKDNEGEGNKAGTRTFSVQGSFKDKLPRWFDYIAHLVVGEGGKRLVVTQPMLRMGYQLTAKDRHRTFVECNVGGVSGVMELPLVEGRPDPKFAGLIMARHGL